MLLRPPPSEAFELQEWTLRNRERKLKKLMHGIQLRTHGLHSPSHPVPFAEDIKQDLLCSILQGLEAAGKQSILEIGNKPEATNNILCCHMIFQ